MSNIQNRKDVLSKEQSREYAQSIMNDIKSYNIFNKNDAVNVLNFSPKKDTSFENNFDYKVSDNYDSEDES
ncbi:MAG: hypothetical protein K2I67_00405 [Malacoplasma sp.]|nr:hypothetical protein [Malacoplasma sp.]